LLSRVSADSGCLCGLLPGLPVVGVGSGLAFPSAQVTGLSEVRAEVAGLASGLMTAEAVLEAVVRRAAGTAMTALAQARPAEGPPAAALERLLVSGWRELGRDGPMAQAAPTMLSADAMARSHRAAYHEVADLVDRGRRDGSFRADLPAGWLVTCCFTLIHACADEVRAGRMDPADAERALVTTIRDLFTGKPDG
jgi:AcrR family transcriptional regulator